MNGEVVFRLMLKNHAAEASGIRRFFTQSLKPGVNEKDLPFCVRLDKALVYSSPLVSMAKCGVAFCRPCYAVHIVRITPLHLNLNRRV